MNNAASQRGGREARDRSAARRLKALRIKAGFTTAADAAEIMGVNLTTYYQHESGLRPISKRAAEFYSLQLKTSAAEILWGDTGLQSRVRVLIVGSVGLDGWVEASIPGRQIGRGAPHAPSLVQWFSRAGWKSSMAGQEDGRKYTDAPPGVTAEQANRLAVITIMNDVMAPSFICDDAVHYDTSKPDAVKPGGRCVVVTADGQCMPGFASTISKHSVTLAPSGTLPARRIDNVVACWPVLAITHMASVAVFLAHAITDLVGSMSKLLS